jgi:gamma-glutamyltranspeptidase
MAESLGAVASPHFLASESAADVLRAGGNAVDAVLTAAAVLTVVYPHQCTVAGDAVALVAGDGEPPIVVNGSGRAPRTLSQSVLAANHMPSLGPDTVTVPGALAAWEALATGWGRRPLAASLRVAASAAADGAAVAPSLARDLAAEASVLARDVGARNLFFADGDVLAEGMTLRQPAAARSLTQLSDNGIGEFYRGDLGAQIVQNLRAAGGSLTAEDFSTFEVEVTRADSVEFLGDRYFGSSGNTQGGYFLAALAALNYVTEELGVVPDPLGSDGVVVARVLQVCGRRRDQNLGDRGDDASLRGMLTPDGAAALARWALNPDIRDRLLHGQGSRRPDRRSGDTVAIVAADGEGTWVTLIQSAYYAFGAGIVDPTTGFVLHNRGAAFSTDPGAPNALRPGIRPPHTLMPVLVSRDDSLVGAHGTMGGRVQPQVHTQLALHTALGDTAETAIGRPRWILGRMEHGPGLPDGEDDVSAEVEVGDEVRNALEAAGFSAHELPSRSDQVGHAQMVRRQAEQEFCAATDPRADGAALVVAL